MTPMLAHLTLAISAALFASLWEGALIVGVVWIGLRCLPNLGAATRYAIWLCTLASLVVIPLLTVLLQAHPLAASVTYALPIAQAQEPPAIHALRVTLKPPSVAVEPTIATPAAPGAARITVPQSVAVAVALLWMLVACARALLLAFDMLDLAAIRRDSRPWPSAREYPIRLSHRTKIPLAIGFLRPAIILPMSLIEEQSADSLETILVHETAHLRRYDVWTNALVRILEVFVALNPSAWFVLRRLSTEREIACDDWVVARLGAGEVFARALATMANCASARAPLGAPSAIGSRHSVVARIESLLDAGPRRLRLSPSALGGALMLLAIIAIVVQSVSPILAYAAPSHATTHGIGCAVPNRSIERQMVLYTHAESKTWYAPLPTAQKLIARFGAARVVPVNVTVDAAGIARKAVVVSGASTPGAAADAAKFLTNNRFKPAMKNCARVSSTIRTGMLKWSTAAGSISIVAPSYPNGWSARHASACKVPSLIHGGVPTLPAALKLPLKRTLSASAHVRVNPAGSVTSVAIVSSSGNPAFDNAVIAAARAATYPLDGSTGFQPVRPNGATLAWNVTHGYSQYSKCNPLPTGYLWSSTYLPKRTVLFVP